MYKGERIVFGHWPKEANCVSEPLEWLVLNEDREGNLLLIASEAIERLPFNRACDYTTWNACTLRAWLNGGFLALAFDDKERLLLQPNECGDVVSCLTVDQVRALLRGEYDKLCDPTPYSVSRGALNPSEWWLRSDRAPQLNMPCISADGGVNGYGSFVDKDDVGVRPAIVLRPQAGEAFAFRQNEWEPTDAIYLGIFDCKLPLAQEVDWEAALDGGYCAWQNAYLLLDAGVLDQGQRRRLSQAAAYHRLWHLSVAADAANFTLFVREHWGKSRKTGQDPVAVGLVVTCGHQLERLEDKAGALTVLACNGFVSELQILLERDDYATRENLQQAIKGAQEAGSVESLSLMMRRRNGLGGGQAPSRGLEL